MSGKLPAGDGNGLVAIESQLVRDDNQVYVAIALIDSKTVTIDKDSGDRVAKVRVRRIEVVSRPAGSKGFVLLHRRWVVERTFAWLGRYRRNSRDYEWFPRTGEAMVRISSIHRMLRILSPDQSKTVVPFRYRESQAIITG